MRMRAQVRAGRGLTARASFARVAAVCAILAATGCSKPLTWQDTTSTLRSLSDAIPAGATLIRDNRRCDLGDDCRADAEQACHAAGFNRALIVSSSTVRDCDATGRKAVCIQRHALHLTACW